MFSLLLLQTSAAAEPNLSGSWKMTLYVTTAAHVPLLGDTLVESERVNLIELDHREGVWVQYQQPCFVETRSDQRVAETILPDSFVTALPTKSYPVRVWNDGSDWRYAADLRPEYLGYDPKQGDLPDEAGQAHIVDSDQDGRPAVTVGIRVPLIGDVEAYIVQEAHTWLVEGIIDASSITGTADVRILEQNVIGASYALFARQPEVEVVPGLATFVLEKVPDGSSCEDLKSE